MKTTEVNASIVGRKCLGMAFGELVKGTITEVEENEHVKTVYFVLDEPINWGGDIYTKQSNWARKTDEFGSLKYMELID